jgi:peptide/nickel transport system permease protein
MFGLIVRRALFLPVVLTAALLITFVLGTYGPGDPAQVAAGTRAVSPERLEAIRQQRGLDRSVPEQFATYVGNLALNGDFGESYRFPGRSVNDLMAGRIWRSFQINIIGFVGLLAIGIPIGILVARYHGTWIDRLIVGTSIYITSVPIFVAIPILFTIFVRWLRVLPARGYAETDVDLGFAVVPLNFLNPWMLMPLGLLVVYGLSGVIRMTRASVVEILGGDYVRTAWAKGLSGRAVWFRHIFRNALIPIVTLTSLSLSGLLSGSFFVEIQFGIPGVGRLLFEAVGNRDFPVVMASVVIYSTAFVVSNVIADIMYGVVDPRVRVS